MKHFASIIFKLLLCLQVICSSLCISAQPVNIFHPSVNRILFVLDGSGSMNQQWQGKSKFELAKELLFKIIDSVERKNPNVEFGVRVFGFQYPHQQHNCQDSKLLIPFAKENAENIRSRLKNIHPQGMTPIAYSIQQGAKDFPEDNRSLNSMILITDGEENCEGDPCKASEVLAAKKIALKPFIVGLNVDSSDAEKFHCIGTLYNTQNETDLYQTVGVIIRQTLNTTTTQVNLLDQNQNPTVTNIPFTLYDHYTHRVEYNFVQTLNVQGNPDTLFLDPVGIYDLELHSNPPVWKKNIELIPGKHNIIALDAPIGALSVACYGASLQNNDAQVLVRSYNNKGKYLLNESSILNVQNLNETADYLSDKYRLEILTTPIIRMDTTISASGQNNFQISNYGTLTLIASKDYLASIYIENDGTLNMVDRFVIKGNTENRQLLPGSYRLVYRPKNSYHSDDTRTQLFTIDDSRTVVINLPQ